MVSNRPSSSNSSFKVSSSSSSSSSISSQCSSPSFLLQAPTISQSGSKLSVPFLWEVKPGITKQPAATGKETQGHYLSNSSSLAKAASSSYSRNLFYNSGKSLEYPPYPLPPPPRLSQAFLSQPRSRDRKLLPTHSLLLRRRPHADATSWKKSSKEAQEEQDDPFFLAMKACTKAVTKISTSSDLKPEKAAGFDGLQAALRGFLKHTNKGRKLSMAGSSKEFIQGEPLRISEGEPTIFANPAHPVARQCPTGGRCRRKYEESDDHRSTKEKNSVNEEGKGIGKGVGTSRAMHGSLHALFSQVDESENKGELRSGSNLHTHILERDKEIPNQRSEQSIMPRKEAHVCHRYASGKPSSIGLLGHVQVGVAEKARMQGDPLATKSSRNDHPINLDGGGQCIEPANNRRRHGFSSKHNAKTSKELINIDQGHGKPSMQHNPKGFEELNSLNQGHDKPNKLINAKVVGYNMMNEYSDHHHHEQQLQSISSKNNIFSDLLGCRSALPCLIDGASIHPSLMNPFSFHH